MGAHMAKTAEGRATAFHLPAFPVRAVARSLAAIAIVSLLLSLSGAYGTGAIPLVFRTLFWLSLLLTARLTALAVGRAVQAASRSWPAWASTGAYLIVVTPAIALALSVLTCLLFRTPLQWDHVAGLIPPVFVITAFMTLLFDVLDRVPFASHARSQASAVPVALVSRLPEHLKDADIHALSAEDHYLRIHTSLGDALILLSFTEALGELDGIEGTQTHRSHWVAKSAIVDVDKSRGKIAFCLKGGLKIPVSRTYRKALRADGWFSP